ncbi:PAAR domain-containing protein [Aureliella helgolandensis]|uniref:PAAR motif protein n=1 Tax=Aureliella helgolandensis TaxID=2527968 RepID=A0A518GCT0_9BACT|nr:PAAR domain-containing protein [Aureliella helgolandensis]QDV26399.1 PAAR motif protein [Aureliella helgolandensis]
MGNILLAIEQKLDGVTGDQTSSIDRMANTPNEVLGVATRYAESVGKASEAWGKIGDPGPNGNPPTTGETAARTIRAAQQTAAVALGVASLGTDMLDVGFANLTAPLAAICPSMPAATLMGMYIGTPHCHPTHPPSGPPPIPPTPLPSIGMVTLGMSVKVLINNLPAARAGDIGLAPSCCGIPPAWFKIKTGSSNVFIGGARAARTTDICQACKNIPDPPVASAFANAMQVAGIAVGAMGMAADVAEAAVEDQAAMAAAKAMSAAMAAAQMAADAAKMAVEATMWKDPTMPPTGSMGAITLPSSSGTVLIGGFPMISVMDLAKAIMNRLKRFKAKSNDDDGAGTGAC